MKSTLSLPFFTFGLNNSMSKHYDDQCCTKILLRISGYIGDGMLSASVSGHVFTCCSSLNIYQAIKYLKNYNC